MPDMQAVGERILLLRRRAKLTQEQLAAIIGISRQQMTAIERGKASEGLATATLTRIAAALGVTPNDLLGVPEDTRW